MVVDGSTATTVNLGADGSVTVGIAPATARDGVSLNRFSDFSVPPAGAALDNRAEAARTIVTEVTGTSETRIEGPVEVLGQRAHVIVANPNGILIDNGRFINTGRVALTTGTIGTRAQQIAPGIFQSNVTSSVTQGRIRVAGGGLSGQMDEVALIARQLQLDGPLRNDSTADGATIRLIAGQSETEFDSAVLPGNTGLAWGRTTGGDDGSGVIVELGDTGLIQGGRIEILVTDRGAGVRLAGEGRATARDFSVTTGGDIVTDRATLASPTGIALNAGADIAMTGSTLSSEGSIVLDAVGGIASTDTVATAFAHLLATAEDAAITGGAWEASEGAFILTTRGGDASVTGARLQGGFRAEGLANTAGTASQGALTLDVAGDLTLDSAAERAIIFGLADDTVITTGGDLQNRSGRILANSNIALSAGGTVANALPASAKATAPDSRAYTRKGDPVWWTLGLKRKRTSGIRYDYGTLEQPENAPAIVATAGLGIDAAAFSNRGGEVSASGGDLTITAGAVETVGLGTGEVALKRTCVLTCRSTATGDVRFVGGQLTAANDVIITATDGLTNHAGQIRALGTVAITAPQVTLKAAAAPTLVRRPAGLYNFWSSKDAWLLLRDQFGTIVADTGRITVDSPLPVRTIGGSLLAGTGITLGAGEEIVRAPRDENFSRTRSIGLLAGWPGIGS